MSKIGVPYLQSFTNDDGTRRHYFAPRQADRRHGWATVRLHDRFERPIRDDLEAAQACAAVADIYRRWRNGEDGYGPWRIDKLGRVVEAPARKKQKGKLYPPGTIGAMVADFRAHPMFGELSAKTQKEYTTYLGLLVEQFGETQWRRLSPGAARTWLMQRAIAGGKSGAHALYRTARAFFNQVRLIYEDVDHPGIVPKHENPLASLNLSLPSSNPLPWPREAVRAFIELADGQGQPSLGDAMVFMSWLGVRRQDWLDWPADFFDRPLLAFQQSKTGVPNVIPWDQVPELVARVAAARARQAASAVRAARFFTDRAGVPWRGASHFRDAFNDLREQLAATHPSFPTRYYVGLVAGDPLAVPTEKLTIRTLRHTCVTFNFDAGVPAELIRGITGHSADEIEDILKHYRARTADQAAAALQLRLDHEAKGAKA
ncbi:hypothetical protein SAMN02745126_04415 [Enhydrobacter aerosaccus]|uniref:Phage integrase family protein n=1 Tax=Enhydrobacter aerosaccus TaxID=225324 RepID=A0A1T4S890_9HYPH|nr:hypothetical protein [Enhydrobacter aerosaccus]SKA24540.1 hypothetical protein SAMN02745126_04415 [Enhydrobacter aerosaccus]